MAITASGTFFKTIEKFLNGSTVVAWNDAACKYALCGAEADSTPDFDAWDFRADIDEESGPGYTAGGDTVTNPAFSVPGSNPATDSLEFDFDNPQWTSSTLTSAAGVHCSGDATNTLDEINFLQYFGGDVSTVGGTFTVTIHATDGAWVIS